MEITANFSNNTSGSSANIQQQTFRQLQQNSQVNTKQYTELGSNLPNSISQHTSPDLNSQISSLLQVISDHIDQKLQVYTNWISQKLGLEAPPSEIQQSESFSWKGLLQDTLGGALKFAKEFFSGKFEESLQTLWSGVKDLGKGVFSQAKNWLSKIF